MKKYIALASAIALSLGVNSMYNSEASTSDLSEYILQGATKATIVEDVNSVGGQIVHEYSVIDAVSVRLSSSQLAKIKQINPMLRSFKDQALNVSSVIQSFSSDNVEFDLKKKLITWKGVNSSNSPVIIDSIDLNLPSSNKKIKSVSINGVKLSAKKVGFTDSISLSSDEIIELGAGQGIQVEVKFAKISSTDASDYQVSFGESMPNSIDSGSEAYSQNEPKLTVFAASGDEDVVGKVLYSPDTNEINWTISNTNNLVTEISKVNVKFPNENIGITSLFINEVQVAFDAISSEELLLNNNQELLLNTPIQIQNNKAFSVRLGFDVLSSADNEDYELALEYTDGESNKVVVPVPDYEEGSERDTNYPSLVRADLAHQMGLTGYGVTIAILDTGVRNLSEINYNTYGGDRAITVVEVGTESKNKGKATKNDENGHGTHLASIITNSSPSINALGEETGSYNGIAPDANLVVVKAFDAEGQSNYLDILSAVEYVVENKDVLNIKVLNLSFSALPSSYYWDDPLNQALMKAWQAGITVVAAAGNRGPEAMTIGVPGNTPYVITVGAVSDNYTPDNLNDDFVTTFSSAGPTYEGFVKPELVAPGGHIEGVMGKDTLIRETYAMFAEKNDDDHNYFAMSGSSQSTAVTSGIVALMLQANPNLTPDDIKCRLIETAKAATTETGELAFSVFQQGAGLVDAMAAIESTETGCSNTGLSIAKDLSGEEHFIGPARRYENDGDFYIPGIDGLEWSGVYSDSQLWRNTSFNSNSQLWRNTSFNSNSQLWRHTSFNSNSQLWRNTSFSADSQLWRNTSFNADSQLWRNMSFNADSQLWRNTSFNADSQLWRNTSFNSDSITREWVNHE